MKSIKMNMIMNVILTMSSFIFPLITFPYISRILLPDGVGKISFATSIISYFTMFAKLGVPTYGISVCAKVRDDKVQLSRVTHELLMINCILSIFMYLLLFVSTKFINRLSIDSALLIIMGISIILDSVSAEWFYKAIEDYSYITIRSVLFKAIAMIFMFLFVHNSGDYILYGVISIFASSASGILNCINLKRHIYIHAVGKYHPLKHIKKTLTFFWLSVTTVIYTNLDNVMLGFMIDDAEVGYYSAAVKVRNVLMSIVTSLSAVILPRASYYVDNKEVDKFYNLIRKTMHFVCLVSIPTVIYFFIYTEDVILVLSGKNFLNAAVPLRILLLTIVMIGITNLIGIQMMVPLGREDKVLMSTILGAITDLIINFILIGRYGCIGTAVGTLAAEFVVLLYQIYSVKDIKIGMFHDISFAAICIASIISGGVVALFRLIDMNILLRLSVSACVFFILYGLAMVYIKDEFVYGILNGFHRKKVKE